MIDDLDFDGLFATGWALVGFWAATKMSERYGIDDIPAVFVVTTTFLVSYIIADEFIRRSKCR